MSRGLRGPLRDVPNETGLASDPLTVHVKNVPDVYISEESLEMLFESKTFNHVPSVKKVVLLGNNEATVTFDYPDDKGVGCEESRN
ncbi:hypothetical protein DPMN_163163 [Dreissena polymorpha]|uniref:Uncharacterized protein n=1 Tax=Dreissena polymorpha TaxID=45954 RepID=A0A9D4ERK0_DREPO|nr:hypothetical protein DPMN_163163 [Dreissena polymorpha]